MKKRGILIIKFTIAGALLAYLYQKGVFDQTRSLMTIDSWVWLIPANVSFPIILMVNVLRLRWLFAALNIQLSFFKLMRYTCIGQFFSVCLPGYTSGDIIKAGYLARETGKTTESVFVVILDRVVGLISLMLLTLLTILGNWHSIRNIELLRNISFLIFAVTGGSAVLALLIFKRSSGSGGGLETLASQKDMTIWSNLRQAVHIFRYKPGCILKCMVISMGAHVCTILEIYFLGRALQESVIGLSQLSFLAPVGLLFSAIPISPIGLGIGEAAFDKLYGLYGSPSGASVMLTYHVFFVFWGLVCGGFYLYQKSTDK